MAGISLNNTALAAGTIRQLDKASGGIGRAYERLSSGQRINRASDDAAGLAIASSLNLRTRVFTQGVRNVNDAQSVLTIADSTLGALSEIITRLTELAEQSGSGSLSNTQRKSLDQEAQSLSKEYSRISRSTSFNGIGIFDGSLAGGLGVQAGFSNITSTLGGNLATGTFGNFTATSPNSGTSEALIDVNGDGIADLITVGASVNINLGNGDGSFYLGSSYSGVGTSISVGDFNNDGYEDFAVGGGTTVRTFQNLGNGTFTVSASFTTSTAVTAVALADLNGDGKVDLAYSDSSSHLITRTSAGNGTFSGASTYTLANTIYSIAAGDLSGDGLTDLAISFGSYPYGAPTTAVFLANGNGSLRAPKTINTYPGSFAEAGNSIKIGDLNNDGVLDIITVSTQASSATNYTYTVSLGNGNGTFLAAVSRTDDLTASIGDQIELGDFNADGKLDAVISNSTSGLTRILVGNGNGSFSLGATFSVGGSIAVGDINNDGAADLMIGNKAGLMRTVSGVNPLLDFSLKTMADSRQALPYFQRTLNLLSSQRSVVGAFQSRTNSAIATLQATTEQYISARGRIMDADIASEAADLARLKILQQSSVATLAQGDKSYAIALKLLT